MPDSENIAPLMVGVVAHRDLLPTEETGLRQHLAGFFERLRREHPGTPLRLLCGLAEGGDQLAAEVALGLGIPLVAALPMPRRLYAADFDAAGLARFDRLLAEAEVLELPLAPGCDEAAIARAGAARDRQYARLGVFIASHSQILLALWDGKPSDALGGTAQIVHYHLFEELPGQRRISDAPNLFADDDNDLVFHIVCSRHRDDGGPKPPLQPLQTRWLTADAVSSGDEPMPAAYAQMFRRTADFNADARKYRERIGAEACTLLPKVPPAPLPAGVRRIDALFAQADWLAVHFQRRVNDALLAEHVIAVLMGLSFLLYSELDAPPWFIGLFLVLFGLGLAIWRIGERREWHRRYLDYRVLAEGLRVQCHLALAGVAEPDSASFAYDSFLQKQDVELGWIRHVMRGASLRGGGRVASSAAWLDWVGEHWVGHAEPPGGQLGYFKRRAILRERHYHRTRRLGLACLALGLLVASILMLAHPWIDEPLSGYLLVAMGMLALIAGVREAYSFKKADKELIKQYRFMTRVFGNARKRLDRAGDDAERRRVLAALGDAALEEHAEWILLHRDRPLEHSAIV